MIFYSIICLRWSFQLWPNVSDYSEVLTATTQYSRVDTMSIFPLLSLHTSLLGLHVSFSLYVSFSMRPSIIAWFQIKYIFILLHYYLYRRLLSYIISACHQSRTNGHAYSTRRHRILFAWLLRCNIVCVCVCIQVLYDHVWLHQWHPGLVYYTRASNYT